MLKKLNKKIAICLFILSLINSHQVSSLTIALDAGHGGKSPGCVYSYNGHTILEKNLNSLICTYIKKELEQYKDVKNEKLNIVLTRPGDSTVSLQERVNTASKHKANALISLHFNAHPIGSTNNSGGSMVISTISKENQKIYNISQNLATNILKFLKIMCDIKIYDPKHYVNEISNKIVNLEKQRVLSSEQINLLKALKNCRSNFDTNRNNFKNGILHRASDNHRYSNGSPKDYYGIIRLAIDKSIPSIIVEHAYLSDEHDYYNYISSDEKLKNIAHADAQAIAKTFNLHN